MSLALVTGATSGIGRAFARHLARAHHDLIVVARTRHRLEELAEDLKRESGVRVEILPADLSTAEGCRSVEDRLAAPPFVDLLVNNAGIMLREPFPYTRDADEERLLAVNVRAVLRLTHAALPVMIERETGRIVNVASFSAHGSGGLATTYPASKSWVLAFSEAVGRSAGVRRAGVGIMALLPGFTRTELHERSGIDLTGLPRWMWLDADRVADAALRDL
ncbi:SDR family NAD(P)-dependent oxidoreductase [Streptomyces mutabilis]|uniref:SDR family NAD(P)-dependent oxidoreductase n=1 Tax=Streptomyces mutabilis TaxID=67332 RepID=UPI0022BA43B3|nr:SDR family NAD(P)-dependent oxidoreductase [Streptomyces mutabilis]MCZ9351026.1 SDR family NAD(P)-dependent oxidoreductase [Streptomyces mutabilis]